MLLNFRSIFFFSSLIITLLITIPQQQDSFMSFAQESFDDSSTSSSMSTMTMSETSSESVTSNFDAILKAGLIISQVAILGLIFNHFILKRTLYLQNKNIQQEDGISIFVSGIKISKRFIILVLVCCIFIIAFSTGAMLLQSYELAQNLDLDILSAFSILYSTSVGQVWLLRILSSSVILGVIIFYYFILRNRKKKLKSYNKKFDGLNSNGYTKIDRILLISVLILGSINLFSNSMVSHSNSLPSFSNIDVSMDWIHFMAVSIWIGGLFYISTIFLRQSLGLNDKSDYKTNSEKSSNVSENAILVHSTRALMYFSYIAITAITVIGITGLYLGYTHIQSLTSVVFTVYGQILIVKIALAFPMIFIGRYNQIHIYNYAKQAVLANHSGVTRAMAEPTDSKLINKNVNNIINKNKNDESFFFKRINKSLKIESILGIFVLVAASFLSVTSPPALEAMDQDMQGMGGMDGMNSSSVGNGNVVDTHNVFSSNILFLYLVIGISIIILIIGIVSFKKNHKQIKELNILSTNSNAGTMQSKKRQSKE